MSKPEVASPCCLRLMRADDPRSRVTQPTSFAARRMRRRVHNHTHVMNPRPPLPCNARIRAPCRRLHRDRQEAMIKRQQAQSKSALRYALLCRPRRTLLPPSDLDRLYTRSAGAPAQCIHRCAVRCARMIRDCRDAQRRRQRAPTNREMPLLVAAAAPAYTPRRYNLIFSACLPSPPAIFAAFFATLAVHVRGGIPA